MNKANSSRGGVAKSGSGFTVSLALGACVTIFGLAALALSVGASDGSRASGANQSVRYVAMGDSYTSGPAIPEQQSDDVPPGCRQSNQNYPHLVAASIRAVEFTDASCAGATTRTISEPQRTSSGTNPAQLDAATAATNFITLEIGGNDVGFMSIFSSCASRVPAGQPCRERFVRDGVDEIAQRSGVAARKVGQTLDAIRARAPHAEILLVGYPDIFPADGADCWPQVPITPSDMNFLSGELQRFNAALASEAASRHVGYVNIEAKFIGRDACMSPSVRWIEPAVPVNPALAVHPNAAGQRAMAAETLKRITDH